MFPTRSFDMEQRKKNAIFLLRYLFRFLLSFTCQSVRRHNNIFHDIHQDTWACPRIILDRVQIKIVIFGTNQKNLKQ